MKSVAAHLRDKRRIEGFARTHTDRRVEFNYQGAHYVVVRNHDMELLVLMNGKPTKRPPKRAIWKAQQELAILDVEEVHGL